MGGAFPLSKVDVRQFIDDEYTPSIFKVMMKQNVIKSKGTIQTFCFYYVIAFFLFYLIFFTSSDSVREVLPLKVSWKVFFFPGGK